MFSKLNSTNARHDNYWKEIFAFASAKSDEASLGGEDGSPFTLALKKAFNESVATPNSSLDDWIQLTKTYTRNQHPVERLSPDSLRKESLL